MSAGGATDQQRHGQGAAAGLGEQLGTVRHDQGMQLALERVHPAGQRAQLRDLLARDPDAGAGGQPMQPSIDAGELPRLGERAAPQRSLELGAQLEQMPAQPVLGAGALGDEILAVIG